MTFRYPPTWRVIADGQSLSTDTSGGADGKWIDHLMRGRGEPAITIAVDGEPYGSPGGLTDTQVARMTPYVDVPTLETIVVILQGGQANLAALMTAEQLYEVISDYADTARAAGATHVIAQTMPPNLLSNPGVTRPAYNALLIADADNKFDAVVDVDVAPLDDSDDTTYYPDNLHWSSAACLIVAGLCAPALDAIVPP